MFSRAEAKALQDEPLNYWRMFAAEAPELQALALKVFNQSTNASACEGNWSSFEYIFNKRRNLLGVPSVEKLVYIHGNLRNMALSRELGKRPVKKEQGSSSSLLRYLQNLELQEEATNQ